MRVVDLIENTAKTAFSSEVLPPLKGTGIERRYEDIDSLRKFEPQGIHIGTHRSKCVYRATGNGLYERASLSRQRDRKLMGHGMPSIHFDGKEAVESIKRVAKGID